MKHIFTTVSTAALLMGAVACSNADSGMETAAETDRDIYAEQPVDTDYETADATGTQTDAYGNAMYGDDVEKVSTREAYLPGASDFYASELIGEAVVDANGEEVGEVEDIMISTANSEPMLIIRDGIAGKLRPVAFTQTTMTTDEDGDFVTTLDLTDASLEDVPEFTQEGYNDYRLASEVIGTNIELAFSDEGARVTDYVMGSDGKAKYAVISDGIVDALSSERIVVAPEKIVVAQGDSDGELTLDLTADEYDAAMSVDVDEEQEEMEEPEYQ